MEYNDYLLRHYFEREEARDNRWEEIESSLHEQHLELNSPMEFYLSCNRRNPMWFDDIEEAIQYAGNADNDDDWTLTLD